MFKDILLQDYQAYILLQWPPQIFEQVCKYLKLQTVADQTGENCYTRFYKEPYDCSVEVRRNGEVYVRGGRDFKVINRLVTKEIICYLVNGPLSRCIFVMEELKVTKFNAIILLSFELDIPRLQQQLGEQCKMGQEGSSVEFPKNIHKMKGVSIILQRKRAKIVEAQLVNDLDRVRKYLETTLRQFRIQPLGMKSEEKAPSLQDFKKRKGDLI